MLRKKKVAKKTIMLVEDDQAFAQNLGLLLETRGYNVRKVTTGKKALEIAKDSVDLILLDLFLPDMEGFEVCRRLKESGKTSDIPIIILSGEMLPKDMIEGLYLGADDYLAKPFEYEELLARMEAVMRRSTFFRNGRLDQAGSEKIIEELRTILREEKIVPFFQPIYLLEPFRLYGVEVLSRPTTDSLLANPELLFKAAIKFGFYRDLEILSWRKAMECAGPSLNGEKIFLNCNPYLVESSNIKQIRKIFEDNKINIRNVVLEITERSAISEYKLFYQQLQGFRSLGLQFAVDDVGGGYASLEAIVETKPEVLKIDRHIIGSLNEDEYKKSIVKFIVAFCRENKILCIAEGIETLKDLQMAKRLGVDAGQGYYLYRPTNHFSNFKFKEVTVS